MGAKLSSEIGFNLNQGAALKALYYKVQNQVFMMTYLQLVAIMMITLLVAIIPLYRLKLHRGPVKIVDAH